MGRALNRVISVAILASLLLLGARRVEGAVIGIIYPECCQAYETAVTNLRNVLFQGGYEEGDIYAQKPSSDPMSWSNAFRKFIGIDADLIVIFGDELVDIACREKSKVPVVFGFVSDPAGAKCVKSQEQPGSNVTGVSGKTPIFTLLDKSRLITPFATIGVFSLKGDRLSKLTSREIESHGGSLGYSVVSIPVSKRSEMAEALATATPFDILFLPNFSVGEAEMTKIAATAKSRNTPTLSLRPAEAKVPALLSLYPDPAEQGRLIGELALVLLKGGSPAKTKITNPKKIELEVDVGMARQFGLKVPLAILKLATKVKK